MDQNIQNTTMYQSDEGGFRKGIKTIFSRKPAFTVLLVILLLAVTAAGTAAAFTIFRDDKAVFRSTISADNPIKQHLLKVDGSGSLIAKLTDRTEQDVDKVRYSLSLLDSKGEKLQQVSASSAGGRVQLVEPVTPGVYSFTVSSDDELTETGASYRLNITYPSDVAEFTDDTAPLVSIASPALGDTVSGTIVIAGEASDETQLEQISVKVDEGEWIAVEGASEWSLSLDTSQFDNGQRIVTVMAIDAAGNSAEDVTLYNFDNPVNPNPDPDPDPNPNPDPDPDPNPNPSTGLLFSEDFTNPSSLDRFNTVTWHRDPYFGNNSFQGDHAPVAGGSDPDNCTNPFTTRTIGRNSPSILLESGEKHVYRCAPGDDPAKAHVMTAQGPESGYDFTAMWTKDAYSNIAEVSWDQNVTDLGGRNWSELKIVPERTWNPMQPPCGITWVPCWTFADGGAPETVRTHADMDSVGFNWFNGTPLLVTQSDEVSEGWFFRSDWQGSAYNAMEEAYSAFSSPVARFTHTLRDNGDGTVSLFIDTKTEEYGVFEVGPVAGSFPDEPAVVVLSTHDYTSGKSVGAFDGKTWHWDNISIR